MPRLFKLGVSPLANKNVTALDIINVMRSWIGLSRAAQTHRVIIDIYNSHTPLAVGYKVSYNDDYCDTTVSAAFIKLDAVEMIGGTECGVERHVEIFKKAGIWEEDGSVRPNPGWIIVYNWDDNTQPNDGFSDHIGIVEAVSENVITLIEGNMDGGVVGRRRIPIGYGYIRGFAKPKYAPSTSEQTISSSSDPKKSIDEIAQEVIDGKWSNGDTRKSLLIAAGYDFDAVQARVNELFNGAPDLPDNTPNNNSTIVNKHDGVTKTVIDVSYAQQNVDWDKVKPQIDGVILRCGYGSDISSQDDNQWARNIVEVERLGIPYGVYLYSYASNDSEIQSEINHTLRLIAGHKPKLGVFYDLEEASNGGIAAQAAKTWCNKIESAGYRPGIYCGAYFYKAYLNGVHNSVNALWWIAGYGTNTGVPQLNYKPDPGFEYDAWQYTSVKVFNGINGGVDTSEWYADFDVDAPTDNKTNISYRAHCQTYGWMKAVSNGEWAGTIGKAKRLEAIKITPPEGVELEVTAHIQTYGDRVYKGIKKGASSGTGSSANDPIIGTVGESKRIEGVTIKCTKNTTGKKIKYQGHCQKYGDTKICSDGEFCGTKGESKRLEAIRIWFE